MIDLSVPPGGLSVGFAWVALGRNGNQKPGAMLSSMSSVCYALEHKTLTFDFGVKHANCTELDATPISKVSLSAYLYR